MVERRHATAGPGGRSRLLRVGLERASGERRRTGARPRDPAPGRGTPSPVHARPGVRRSAEVGPPDTDIWEVDWDGDGLAVAIASVDPPGGSGWYAADVVRLDLDARTAHTLYEPTWQIQWLSLSPDGARAAVTEGYASDHGLLNGSVMMVNLALAALQRQQAVTDHAVASVLAATSSAPVGQSASAGGQKAIAALRDGLASLPGLRARITDRSVSGQQAFAAYNSVIGASYQVLEQAIIQEGDSTQVLPGIAVIELAISNEYRQQESALLDGNFAAHAFPASDHQAFVRLVGAHRLLYAQSYSYLGQADRSALNHDVRPQTASTLAALEDRLVASDKPDRAPPVRPVIWNRTVAALSAQTQRAVGQAEARLASGARSQASAKLRKLYLAGGLGLAAVLASLVLSLWIAVNLARQLHGLRDSALEMATVRLPDVVRRLRARQDVDVAAQVPQLEAGADEIGQVKTAFNTAQRTAVQAAVDEARVRRGIGDVFRNLARRSQSLLERQMASARRPGAAGGGTGRSGRPVPD